MLCSGKCQNKYCVVHLRVGSKNKTNGQTKQKQTRGYGEHVDGCQAGGARDLREGQGWRGTHFQRERTPGCGPAWACARALPHLDTGPVAAGLAGSLHADAAAWPLHGAPAGRQAGRHSHFFEIRKAPTLRSFLLRLPSRPWAAGSSCIPPFSPGMTSIHLPGPLTSPWKTLLRESSARPPLTQDPRGRLPGPASGPLCSGPWGLPAASARVSAGPGLGRRGAGRGARLPRKLWQK